MKSLLRLKVAPFVLFMSVLLNLLGCWCNCRLALAGEGLKELTLGGDSAPGRKLCGAQVHLTSIARKKKKGGEGCGGVRCALCGANPHKLRCLN